MNLKKYPYIKIDDCSRCKECKPVSTCSNKAFRRDIQESDVPYIESYRCKSCGNCISSCFRGAVILP